VNTIRFITPACLNEPLIISGSVDKTVKLWRRSSTDPKAWFLDNSVGAHTSSINCIAELGGQNIFVTGAADATVKVWQITPSDGALSITDVNLLQSIELTPKFFPLAVAVASLDSAAGEHSKEFVLAVAGTKASIQIYVAKGSVDPHNPFALVATLTGHEAWIMSLAITYETTHHDSSDLIVASASQDKYIRLWRIHRGQDLPASSRALNDPTLGVLAKSSLSNKAHRFATVTQQFSVTFEALLLGHEDWIDTTSWHRHNGHLQLLSASVDNSLAVWEADESTGIWTCIARLGEISAQKGSTSATGSTGGFWLGLWSPDGNAVVSLGRTGGWRLWQRDTNTDSDRWIQKPAVTGHVKEVNGIAWSRDGSYLLSTSNDQTTRLHAEWKVDGKTSWHEFSRPQIHGYDLNCIDTITNNQFISGADEKLLRVFDEPEGVADILHRLCGIEKPPGTALPDAANIPVLGLSNKAVEAVSTDKPATTNGEERDAAEPVPANVLKTAEPPLEDDLARHLLWPEREKLYGHGYEINVVAASHDGSLVATACRASSVDHAVIRLYDTKEWREVKPVLKAHTLTVTGLRFSPNDEYMLSVGRDRQFCIWRRSADTTTEYTLAHNEEKAHSRMVLVADWAPTAADRVFATGGRDKTFKIWQIHDNSVKCLQSMAADVPVTALAFLPDLVNGSTALLAVGLENGEVVVCAVDTSKDCAVSTLEKQEVLQQSKAVTQLTWRPLSSRAGGEGADDIAGRGTRVRQLAIASADSSLHVISLAVAQLKNS
jgi:elongator complex protein 2